MAILTIDREVLDAIWSEAKPKVLGTVWEAVSEKAYLYLLEHTVELTDDGTLRTPSSSDARMIYDTRPTPEGRLECDCRGGITHGRCYHLAMYRMIQLAQKRAAQVVLLSATEADATRVRERKDVDTYIVHAYRTTKGTNIAVTTLRQHGTEILRGFQYVVYAYGPHLYRIVANSKRKIAAPVTLDPEFAQPGPLASNAPALPTPLAA